MRKGDILLAAVVLVGLTIPLFFVRQVVDIARDRPASNLMEIAAKSEWSREARDLFGYWLFYNLANPAIISAESETHRINLKTPMGAKLPNYLHLASQEDIGVFQLEVDKSFLESYKVTGLIHLAECSNGASRELCPIFLYITEASLRAPHDISLIVTRIEQREIALVEAEILHPRPE